MLLDDSIFASGLGSNLSINPEVDTVVSGVTYTNISSVDLGDIMPITIQNTTTWTGNAVLQIGDPDGVIRNTFGIVSKTWDNGDYLPNQLASFFRKGAIIRGYNLETTNVNQYAMPFNYYAIELDGSAANKDIRGSLVASRRATDSDGLIRTLDFGYDSGVLMNHSNAMYITQLASTTLTLTIELQSILR
jgi:hypothetical protein